MKKIDPSSSDLCWRGCGQVGTLIHMLWHCPAVKSSWEDVVHSVSLMLKLELSPCPLICLLGYRAAPLRSKRDWKIAGPGFLVAKRMIFDELEDTKDKLFFKRNLVT